MTKSGAILLTGDGLGDFLEVGQVVMDAGFEVELEVVGNPWARFAEDIIQINHQVHEYGQRSRPWLRQKKGRGAQ